MLRTHVGTKYEGFNPVGNYSTIEPSGTRWTWLRTPQGWFYGFPNRLFATRSK